MNFVKAKQLFNHIKNSISKEFYTEEEITSVSFILLEDIYGISKVDIITDRSLKTAITEQEIDIYLSRLHKGEPLQHITGKEYFDGLIFNVNKHVLIPRPETEELVNLIKPVYSQNEALHILDIGTGSGCIAVSLAHYFNKASVYAMDFSKEALEIAAGNAKTNAVENIKFVHDSILSPTHTYPKFDLIVSNPPYIPESDKSTMNISVLDYEPGEALFVKNDASLIFYERIVDFAYEYLNKGGSIFFECHHILSVDVTKCFKSTDYESVELIEDWYGKKRFVKTRKKV